MNKGLADNRNLVSYFATRRGRLFIMFCVIAAGMVFYSQPALSQPHFEWVRNYPIIGRAAAIDSSGYVYFVGEQTGGTQKILKYDSLGNIIWTKEFNVITGSNYLGIAAYKSRYLYITYSTQGHSFGLSKFDTSGTLMWTKNISGYYYEPMCITLDTSGNIYVAGEIDYYASNSFTVKYNPDGDTLWRAIYYPSTNGGGYIGRSISVDNQKNVFITGGEIYQSMNSYTTIKYDSLGNRKWVSKYFSPYSPYSSAGGGSVKADNKGNCYVTGYITYTIVNGFEKFTPATIKYGPNGDSIWTRLFRLQDTIDFGAGEDMVLDDNDNVFIPCNYMIKYDKYGNLKWYANNNFYLRRALLFENNIYGSGGIWDDRIQMLGYDNDRGNVIFNQIYPTTNHPVICDGNLTFGNSFYIYAHDNDSLILIKFSSYTSSISGHGYTIDNFKLHQNYPNPFNSSTTIRYSINKNSEIKMKVFDIKGKEVRTITSEKKTPGIYEVKFDGGGLSSGIYFYSLFADNIIIDTKKLILIK
ncbi:MAG: T9SS type A sorting domain-containing protein [Ignavibacteria bacterium]